MFSRNTIWVLTFTILNCIYIVLGSNFDIDHPIFIKNVADGPESLFGASVLLVKDHNDSPGIIIGAPRGNSTLKSHEDIVEPGVIWQCSFERRSEVCRILTMDETGNVPDKNVDTVIDRKDGGFLGGSLGLDSDNFVSCSSRWSNQFYMQSKNQYFMNGICYWRPRSQIFENNLPPSPEESRLLPLIQLDQQTKNYWGLGQAGFSIHLPPRRKEMIIGAPGVHAGRGSVIRYSSSTSGAPYKTPLIFRPEKSSTKLSETSYFGFAVASGKFFKADGKDTVQYVSGAPRANHLAGEVIVFRFTDAGEDKLEKLFEIRGKQIGSYFGSSICVADVNGDGLDDLLVGAPQFSIEPRILMGRLIPENKANYMVKAIGYGDEGVVFVYINTGTALVEQSGFNYLNGRSRAWSHFGASIVNLGDINNDGFADIAVGAPYELDGTGVVYIYHGSKNGIVKQVGQYIEAKKLDPLLKGFGYSFSERQDLDNNGYNDLAVGAYDSGHVVILRAKPLIIVHGVVNVTSEMGTLPFDTTSFEFEIAACVSYTGEHIPDRIVCQVRVESDSESKPPRVLLQKKEHLVSEDAVQIYEEEMDKGLQSCTKFTAVVRRPLESSGKPVIIKIDVEIPQKSKSNNPTMYEISSFGGQYITKPSGDDYNSFCKNCPMLDKTKSSVHNLHLPLAVLCGDDDKCVSDLKLDIRFLEIASGRPFVIGSSKTLSMEVKVTNEAETAISPSIIVVFERRNLKRTPAECQTFQANETHSSYKCSLGTLLEKDKTVTVLLEFDVTDLVAGGQDELLFEVEATTASELLQPSLQTVIIPVLAVADLFMVGSSSDETFNPGTLLPYLHFSQSFEVSLDGPSQIGGTIIEFSIPQSFTTSSGLFTKIDIFEPHITYAPSFISCYAEKGTFATTGHGPSSLALSSVSADLEAPEIDLTVDDAIKQRELDDPSEKESEIVKTTGILSRKVAADIEVGCDSPTAQCLQVKCETNRFSANSSATITFNMQIASTDLKSLFRRKEVSGLKVMSLGSMKLEDKNVYIKPYSEKPDDATSVTVIRLESTTDVPTWIIWAAIILGFLVLAIVVSCLYTCGVLERKQKPEPEEESAEAIPLQDTTPFNSDDIDDEEEIDITKNEDD